MTVTLEPKTLTADGNDYRIAFIEDPDGYKIELVQRGTMKVGNMYQLVLGFELLCIGRMLRIGCATTVPTEGDAFLAAPLPET